MNRTHRSVVGRAADLPHARMIFSALQNAGIDASDIRLAGAAADAAQESTRTERGRREVDERAAKHIGQRAAAGTIAGALLGALVGGTVAGVLVAVDAIGWLVFAIVGFVLLLLGGMLGALVSVERTSGYDDTWELTFAGDAPTGAVWVVARAEDDESAARIRDLFTREGVSGSEERQVEETDAHFARW